MPDWRKTIRLKQFLSHDSQIPSSVISETALKFAERLKREPEYEDDFELLTIVDQFEDLAESDDATVVDFNEVLAELYDWADIERVWIG
jgi:hypothetical protein